VDITYTLLDASVVVTVDLATARADTTDYGLYPQEVPAVYVNGFLDRLVGYQGPDPCGPEKGAKTEWDAGWDNTPGVWPWLPGHLNVSEPWIAFIQANDFGLGIYSGSIPEVRSGASFRFDAGFYGSKGAGGTKDSATGYYAPIASTDIPGKGTWSYMYTLLVGDVDDIRANACRLWALEDYGEQRTKGDVSGFKAT
jgi:hypothetical protein